MNIHFYANFRQIVGGKTIELDVPAGPTLHDLISILVNRFPALGPAMTAESGQLLPFIHLFVNGRDAQFLPDGFATRIAPTDKIDIFPPVAGG